MKLSIWVSVLALCFSNVAISQTTSIAEEELENYKQVVSKRSHKIVATLGITDPSKFKRVHEIVAQQYADLRQIHDARDRQLVAVKNMAGNSKQQLAEAEQKIEAQATLQQDQLHVKYLANLSKNLTPPQVEKVKDGMTYDVLPITYRNYLAMIPTLKDEEKVQIKAWLSEARENAMDAGSSEEKHAWFGQCKGKITNYLTAAGYALKKQESDWLKRVKAERAVAVKPWDNTAGAIRAAIIIDSLTITDDLKRSKLQTILSEHLDSLHSIFQTRKSSMEIASKHSNKELANARGEVAWSAASGRLNKLHATFLGNLSVELTANQIEKVKDLMTEGGRQREYNYFLNMFPNLNDVQKAQIQTYLTEARENAMDAENADMRNQWFIKYRGRANNFLSAAGYDLRQATEDLKARQ